MSNNKQNNNKKYEDLIKAIPTRAPIFLPTEKIALEERVRGLERVKNIYEKYNELYQPQLKALREKYNGSDRCFIIGNGPSLNETDLSVLDGEVTFAVNGFFLKTPDLNWKPTFYVVEDHLVAEDRQKWINEFKGSTKLFPIYLGYCLNESDDTIFFNHRPRLSYPDGFDFSKDASEVTYTGCTVTFTCMQLAYYLGFKDIYLIGVDASYDIPKDVDQGDDYSVGVLDMKSDDPNHFHPDYFGKGFRWHDPQVHKMVEAYQEAKRVTAQTDQQILNATVGGKLEVFKRVDFCSIIPYAKPSHLVKKINEKRAELIKKETIHNEANPPSSNVSEFNGDVCSYPKLLVIDLTRIGDGTATGELKFNLFFEWPEASLFQFFNTGSEQVGLFREGRVLNKDLSFDQILEKSRSFDPDVILYRPVADSEKLHVAAMTVISKLGKPYVTWIMDDWPSMLREENEERYDWLHSDYIRLLKSASLNLSIGSLMSKEFEKRYGVHFMPVANGVDPSEWPYHASEMKSTNQLVVRYAGSLAANMTLQSIVRIAKVIEILAEKKSIRFEIKARKHWKKDISKHIANLKHTSLITDMFEPKEYRKWLQNADVLVIAYNFDSSSVDYVRYSIANKMPESLASGAAVIAHGPKGIATIDYLASEKCAAIVDEPSESALYEEFSKLLTDDAYRKSLAKKARKMAFENHNLINIRRDLKEKLNIASKNNKSSSQIPTLLYERNNCAHLDETELVFHMYKQHDNRVMVDVGAHFGSSAAPFVDKGWQVYCFEPDPENRKKLTSRFSDVQNVQIDSRAVGEQVEKGKSFYSSNESTGISGMLEFHATHREVAEVDVTTITDIISQHNLDHIDFLKIDVEGYDFSVLKGVPWEIVKPDVIECEFEDAKTKLLGHTWKVICNYLIEKGYTVYVSEWHPIVRYGIRHDWRGLKKYPCELEEEEAWGNLIAFKVDPGLDDIELCIEKVLKVQSTENEVALKSSGSNQDQIKKVSSISNLLNIERFHKMFSGLSSYAQFAEWVQGKSTSLFHIGQFVMWLFRFAKRHLVVTCVAIIIFLILIFLASSVTGSISYGTLLWIVAGLILFFVLTIIGVSFVNKKVMDFAQKQHQLRLVLKDDLTSKLNISQKQIKDLISQFNEQEKQVIEQKKQVNHISTSLPVLNFHEYQSFNRKLSKTQIELLVNQWSIKLSLELSPKSLSYMAHRFCMLESNLRGRLATSIEDIILRVLVTSAVKNNNLHVLEIGTLFGIGLAAIYDYNNIRFDNVHLTAIDPLHGYYGEEEPDLITGEIVNEHVFRENLHKAGVSDQDISLIKMLSTDDKAIKKTAESMYDVLIIDGDHTFSGVQADFLNYASVVNEGGYIVFDDYNSPDWPDVKEFVDANVRDHSNLDFIGASWRTAVFRVKSKE